MASTFFLPKTELSPDRSRHDRIEVDLPREHSGLLCQEWASRKERSLLESLHNIPLHIFLNAL